MDRLDRMLALAREHVPDLELVHKPDSRLMRWSAVVLRPFVPDFSTRFTTVLGSTVYLPRPPEDFGRSRLAATLAHELVHQIDQRRWGALFYLSYGFVLPSLRTTRAIWERRAYAVDLALALDRGGAEELERVAEEIAVLFSGPSYLWMWIGRRSARRFLEPVVRAVSEGSLQGREPYRSILAAWRGSPRDMAWSRRTR